MNLFKRRLTFSKLSNKNDSPKFAFVYSVIFDHDSKFSVLGSSFNLTINLLNKILDELRLSNK